MIPASPFISRLRVATRAASALRQSMEFEVTGSHTGAVLQSLSGRPWEFNAVLRNVISMTAIGLVVGASFGEVLRFRVYSAGRAPDVGEPHW